MRGALFALAAGLSAAVQLRDIQGGRSSRSTPNDQCGVVVSAQEDDRLTRLAVGQDGSSGTSTSFRTRTWASSPVAAPMASPSGRRWGAHSSAARPSCATRAPSSWAAQGADRAIYMLEQQAPNSESVGPLHFTRRQHVIGPRAVLNLRRG